MLRWLASGVACACSVAALAQGAPVDDGAQLAQDLHEQIVRVQVTLKNVYGREETRSIATTAVSYTHLTLPTIYSV